LRNIFLISSSVNIFVQFSEASDAYAVHTELSYRFILRGIVLQRRDCIFQMTYFDASLITNAASSCTKFVNNVNFIKITYELFSLVSQLSFVEQSLRQRRA